MFVGGQIDFLVSISDGTLPSTFVERWKARTEGRKECMDERLFAAEISIFCILLRYCFNYLYLKVACKQLRFPPQNVIIRRTDSGISEKLTILQTFKCCLILIVSLFINIVPFAKSLKSIICILNYKSNFSLPPRSFFTNHEEH